MRRSASGKRPDKRTPLIRDFVPLADLDDFVFGAWDPIPDNAYDAAVKGGVLDRYEQIEPLADFLKSVEPMPAVFGKDYVKRIDGSNTRTTASRFASVEALRGDIRRFKEENNCDRLVMVWCASTEKFITETEVHRDIENFVGGLHDDHETIAPSMVYAYAALMEGVPFVNGAPNLTVDIPALERLAKDEAVPICGKDFKTGQTLVKTVIGPMLKARMLGMDGWFSTNILGNRDGEVLDEPENFKTKEESKLGVLEYILQPDVYPELYSDAYHKVRINYYPPRGDNKEGLGQHRSFRLAWPPDAAQGQLPMLGLDTGRASRARSRPVHGSGAARRNDRHPGVAVLLLQEPAARAHGLPRARPVHPADEAQEHPEVDDGRGPDYPPRHGVLPGRLTLFAPEGDESLDLRDRLIDAAAVIADDVIEVGCLSHLGAGGLQPPPQSLG